MNFSLRAKLFSIIYSDTIHTRSCESAAAPDIDRYTGCRAIDNEKYLYRLGDYHNVVINKTNIEELQWMRHAFPDTLISDFVTSVNDSDDIKSKERKFMEIIRSRIKLTPVKTGARLHLRTGDILSVSRHIGKGWRMYTPVEKFEPVVNKLIDLECNNIIIYTGTHEYLGRRDKQVESHLDDMVDEMYSVGQLFETANIRTEYHSGPPDNDFIEMLSGDIFIPTQGEYSALIASYANKLNKIVITDARA